MLQIIISCCFNFVWRQKGSLAFFVRRLCLRIFYASDQKSGGQPYRRQNTDSRQTNAGLQGARLFLAVPSHLLPFLYYFKNF